MFSKISYFKRKLKNRSLKIFNAIENNGNCNFDENGEKVFINNLMHSFKNEEEKIIFDIGANVGKYSQMIIDKSAKENLDIELHLFEPTKSCFDKLVKKFDSKANIHLNNFGVSNKNEVATIFYDKEESGLASLYQRNLIAYDLELNKNEEIQLKRLDEHIDFMKIDIEGHELKAFEGFGKYLNSDFVDYIQFEYGGANLDSHTSLMDMYKVLNDRGFRIAKIMPNGLEVREYSPYMDNFNYANYVAVSKKLLDKIN